MNTVPDSKVHWANMGPIWGRQDPGGPHVGPTPWSLLSGVWFILQGTRMLLEKKQKTFSDRLVSSVAVRIAIPQCITLGLLATFMTFIFNSNHCSCLYAPLGKYENGYVLGTQQWRDSENESCCLIDYSQERIQIVTRHHYWLVIWFSPIQSQIII